MYTVHVKHNAILLNIHHEDSLYTCTACQVFFIENELHVMHLSGLHLQARVAFHLHCF